MDDEGRAGARRSSDSQRFVSPEAVRRSIARNAGWFCASERSRIAVIGVLPRFRNEKVQLASGTVAFDLRIPRLPVFLYDPVVDLRKLILRELFDRTLDFHYGCHRSNLSLSRAMCNHLFVICRGQHSY